MADNDIFRSNNLDGILSDTIFEYTILTRSNVFHQENNKTARRREDV